MDAAATPREAARAAALAAAPSIPSSSSPAAAAARASATMSRPGGGEGGPPALASAPCSTPHTGEAAPLQLVSLLALDDEETAVYHPLLDAQGRSQTHLTQPILRTTRHASKCHTAAALVSSGSNRKHRNSDRTRPQQQKLKHEQTAVELQGVESSGGSRKVE